MVHLVLRSRFLQDHPHQFALRLALLGTDRLHVHVGWKDPIRWHKEAEAKGEQRLVFTCSLSDFFIEKADEWRPDARDIIKRTPNLTYQILTKRPGSVEKRLPPDWGEDGYRNCWLGASVESKKYLWRMDTLRKVPVGIRFVSAEPLLEDTCPDFEDHMDGYAWFVIGGQSGNGTDDFKTMQPAWARSIVAAALLRTARQSETHTSRDDVSPLESFPFLGVVVQP